MSDVIKDLGLKPHLKDFSCGGYTVTTREAVFVDDLIAAIEKLPVVYGFKDAPHFSGWHDMDKFPNKNPTHQARIIRVEKLVKEPVRVERSFNTEGIEAVIIPDEIKGKPFKVVFEEVIE